MCLSAHFSGFFVLRPPNQTLVKDPQALAEGVQASCPRWRAPNKNGGQNFSWLRNIKLRFCLGQKRWTWNPITMMCAQPPTLSTPPATLPQGWGRGLRTFGGTCVRKKTSSLLIYRSTIFIQDPWVRKISWKRNWPPTPVFLPGGLQPMEL